MITGHFVQRCQDRIGDGVDAQLLGENILQAIREGRDDYVQFIARTDRAGYRLFQFRVTDGRPFFAVVNTDDMVLVTVLTPDQKAKKNGKWTIRLEEYA